MNIWSPPSFLTSEEIVSLCEMFQRAIFPQDSFPDEHAYFQQLIEDNS